jgi:selenocysteine lyase/cysteine desulfurase
MIYMDNAATSLHKPPQVEQAVIEALHVAGNPGRGAHKGTLDAGRIVYSVREKLAHLFNIDNPSRIAFTSNATEALNIAIRGMFHSGDHIITTVCEHNSVLRPLYLLEKEGDAGDLCSY